MVSPGGRVVSPGGQMVTPGGLEGLLAQGVTVVVSGPL